jgi:hypothetical protein
VSEIGVPGLGSGALGGALLREPPTVVVTAPSGPQTADTVTVAWTYASVLSKPQVSYRVQILNQAGVAVLYDSSFIPGADLSFACPFALSGGSQYLAKVTVSDGVDTGSATSSFSSTMSSVADIEPNTDVGSIFEIAINGVGYRLADSPERPYRRSTGQLQAPRLATGDTPFSEAIERYSFVSSSDWTAGAGQQLGSRTASNPSGYWASENVNPFEPGEVSLLPATSELVASAASTVGAVVASGHLFCATASNVLSRLTAPDDATPDTMTFTGDTLGGLASDGTYWYAFNTDEEIFRGTGTTIGSAWATLTAQTSEIKFIEWCSDRLAVVYVNATGQHVVSTLGPDGAEEVAAGRFKYTNATVDAVCAGDGYMWYAVNRTDRTVIYAWQLGSTDAAFIALDMPYGEAVTDMFFYLGNVMIRTASGTIYRAVQVSGELTPERVVQGAGVGPFAGLDRFVLFGWDGMSDDGRSGVGAIDLSTGGWCRWLRAAADTDTGALTSLFVWQGKAGFVVDGSGAMFPSSTLEASGYVTSSVTDLASGLTKVLDQISVGIAPLPANSGVQVAVSFDGGVSFESVGSVSVSGVMEGEWALGFQGASVATKVTLTATGATSPALSMVQVKLHPLSVVDSVVELPISCSDRMSGQNGVEIADSVGGMQRARTLESLVGTRVLLQDVDWPQTGVAEVWEMVSAEYSSVGIYERREGARQEAQAVCVCTLRRAS